MIRPAFVISAGLWATSLALAFWWSFAPLFTGQRPAPRIQTTAADETDDLLEARNNQDTPDEARTRELFRVRLAPLIPPVRASLADDVAPGPLPFDFRNWTVRETKRRTSVSFLGLMVSGALLQWLLNRWAKTAPDQDAPA
jgi:hypothetical protein